MFSIDAVLVAVAFICLKYFNNSFYAKIGGVVTTELNWLEVSHGSDKSSTSISLLLQACYSHSLTLTFNLCHHCLFVSVIAAVIVTGGISCDAQFRSARA